MVGKFLLALLTLSVSATATAGDGFVLTQWGKWTPAQGIQAIENAQRVGARQISVLMHLCQESKSANEISWCDSDGREPLLTSFQGQRLVSLAADLRARGMELSLIPFPQAKGADSRQWFEPTSHKAWFKSYGDRMTELATLGRDLGATEIIVGSELTSLFTDSAGWRAVIQRVREVFHGHLTISPVFYQYLFIDFWDAVDSIGVSNYFPLSTFEARPSVERLEAAARVHKKHLLQIARKYGKPLTFVEAGYPATNMAARQPWDFDWKARTLDLELQARCYEAFRRAWSGTGELRSVRFWGLSAQSNDPEKGFNPIGKPAEEPLRKFFAERLSNFD